VNFLICPHPVICSLHDCDEHVEYHNVCDEGGCEEVNPNQKLTLVSCVISSVKLTQSTHILTKKSV